MKEIDTVWTIVVDENGQEQIGQFLGHAIIMCDPGKTGMLDQIAKMLATNGGKSVKIVKFTAREEIRTVEGWNEP